MNDLDTFNVLVKHVWSEPKCVAQIEWMADHPSLSMQLERQVGRGAMMQFATGGGWPDPTVKVTFVQYDEPDWDWWEPRHDQPWRRQQARDRELDHRLGR